MTSLSIKAARVDKGYTQEALAEKLGLSKNTYLKYENGMAVPKPMFIYALSYVLDMDSDEIRIPVKK